MGSEALGDPVRGNSPLAGRLRWLFLFLLLAVGATGSPPAFASGPIPFGGPGGVAFDTPCASGNYLVGLAVYAGAWVDAIAPVCARFDGDALVVEEIGKFAGHAGGSRQPDSHCRFGVGVITSLLVQATFDDGSRAKFVDNLVAACSKATDLSTPSPGFQVLTGDDTIGYIKCDVGWGCLNHIDIPYPKAVLSCPAGQVATGITGRAGDYVDALSLMCGTPPSKSLAQGGQLPPAPPGGHAGFDRPGNPFNWFSTNDPADCPMQCEPQPACRSWRWAMAGTNGVPVATCYLNRDAPSEVASPCCISGLKGGAASTPLPPAPAGAKSGADRPGSDFKSYALNDPASCQAKCQADGACKAWTWAVPGTNGAAAATCYLKNPAPAEVAAGCCISGLPTALPPAQGGAKTGVDLPGSDFFSFTSNDQSNCALSCAKDARCKAWTWAVAGTNGAKYATCYMKNAVPKEAANNCCVSGLPPTGGGLSSTGGPVTLPPGALSGTDRPGGDIAGAPSPSPASCAQSCGANGACKAWTWAVAGTNGQAAAFCYLKNVVPKAQANNCCVSGLAPVAGGGTSSGGAGIPPGGVVVPPGATPGADRPGGDFAAAPSPNPANCAQACGNSPACKAWTWAVPGTNGQPGAICYLKNVVPPQQASPCCVSGTRTGGGSGPGGSGGSGGSGGGPDFSGNWRTTINGSAPGTLTLFTAGSGWKGTYSALGISGAISNGHIGSDGHLRFSWSQPGATGKGNFVLTGPGSFSGTFYFDANPGAVGTWNGHR